MIFFGCPVGIRHITRIASDQICRIVHKWYPKPACKIHFVYFSCASDFLLLELSLKSLVHLQSDWLGTIFVVVDSKGPFSEEQQLKLKRIVPSLKFLELGRIDWASIHTLRTELQAFSIAASQAHPQDFIAKVDSDILFFSSAKLEEVSVCGADFVGDGHYSGYGYAQGGLYLLRAPLAASLWESAIEPELEKTIAQCLTHAEDQVISALVRRRTHNIWLTRLMLFPDEFDKTNLNGGWVRQEFSALHFVHKKAEMPKFAIQLDLMDNLNS
jgi:hypothetical protein